MEIEYIFGGFQMKTLTVILIMVSMCGVTLFAQETTNTTGESTMEKKGIFSTITNGFAESTRNVHQINQENMAAVITETRTNFEAATVPNPGIAKLNETKGFWNKIKVIFSNMRETANAQAEAETARRAEIQSHDSYRNVLEEQRTNRQAILGQ